jgi:hypothetical protein
MLVTRDTQGDSDLAGDVADFGVDEIRPDFEQLS